MEINTIKNGDEITVAVEGRLDTTTAPDLERELKGCLDELLRAAADQDYEAAGTLCRQAMSVLDERNRLCKLNK